MLDQIPYMNSIVVVAAGGGLISDICIAVKNTKASVKLIVAETELDSDEKYPSFHAKRESPRELQEDQKQSPMT